MHNAYWSHTLGIIETQIVNTGPENDMRPWPRQGTDYRKASVLILLYPRSGEDYVIFTRRTDTVDGREPALLFKPNPHEVAEIIEVPLGALRDDAIHRTEMRTVNGVTHHIHYYVYGPYEIWGATGRIIYEFLNSGQWSRRKT